MRSLLASARIGTPFCCPGSPSEGTLESGESAHSSSSTCLRSGWYDVSLQHNCFPFQIAPCLPASPASSTSPSLPRRNESDGSLSCVAWNVCKADPDGPGSSIDPVPLHPLRVHPASFLPRCVCACCSVSLSLCARVSNGMVFGRWSMYCRDGT